MVVTADLSTLNPPVMEGVDQLVAVSLNFQGLFLILMHLVQSPETYDVILDYDLICRDPRLL